MLGFTQPKYTYEQPGLGEFDEKDPYQTADLVLTGRVADVIQRHYPGHGWMIQVSHEQGVVMISIPLFMGYNKYTIYISTINSDPGLRSVVRAGGEILERYGIPRNNFNVDDFLAALEGIPKHLRAHHGKLAV